MRPVILFLVFFIAFATSEATSEDARSCPKGFHYVNGVGCKPENATCQCPETPCAFPLKCDCEGSCKAKSCTTARGCSLLRNRLDLCERAVCQEGVCVAERLTCAGCNPKSGCPGGHHAHNSVASADTHQQQQQQQEGGEEEEGEEGRLSVKHDDDDDDFDHDHHHHHDNEAVAWQVYFTIAFEIVLCLLLFAVMIYFGSTAGRAATV